MLDMQSEIEQLRASHELLIALEAYHQQELPVSDDSEQTGWLPRLPVIDGVHADELSPIHGRLIALGFLNFRVASRAAGLQYRVSSLGRHALQCHAQPDADDQPSDARGDDRGVAAA